MLQEQSMPRRDDPVEAKRIYLAGPLGFSECGRRFQEEVIVPLLRKRGFVVVTPPGFEPELFERFELAGALRDLDERFAALSELNDMVGAENIRAIDSCSVILAVMDGSDVDSGTAAEIGYGFAVGKRVHGYRGDIRAGENFATAVNVQVAWFVRASGGNIFLSLDALRRAEL